MYLEVKTRLRSMARRMGLIPSLHRLRSLRGDDRYEQRFGSIIIQALQPEDCVWDIGANVGFYTEQFAAHCARVVSFEPVPENRHKIPALPNVTLLPVALGEQSGTATMSVDGPFSSLVGAADQASNAVSVEVMRGDDVQAPRPTIVKLDVEGYELEALRGMREVLRGARAVFIEVHFNVLEQRGLRKAPSDIITELKAAGLTRISWPDASHIAAFRPAA